MSRINQCLLSLLLITHIALADDATALPPTLITQPGPEFSHASRKWHGVLRLARRAVERKAKTDGGGPVRDTPEKLEEGLKKP